MRCNRTTASRYSDLNSPPVPAGFAVEQPTQQELQLRETISIGRGVRPIESAWPGQPPRQAYPPPMSGRGYYNIRRGGGDHYPANNRATSHPAPGNDGSPPDQSSSFPRPGSQTPAANVGATSRGRDVANNASPRTVPLLFSLPTESERIAATQARYQERQSALLEERRIRRIARNSRVEVSSASTEPTGRIESTESLDHARSMSITPSNRRPELNRVSPSPPSSSPPRAAQQSIFVNNDWRSLPEITVRVGPDLPLQYTTWDMYNLFTDYGVVESVELFENSSGTRDGSGRVRFRYSFHIFNFSLFKYYV